MNLSLRLHMSRRRVGSIAKSFARKTHPDTSEQIPHASISLPTQIFLHNVN